MCPYRFAFSSISKILRENSHLTITYNQELLYLNKSSGKYVLREGVGLVPLNLLNSFPKEDAEATSSISPTSGSFGGSAEQCWDVVSWGEHLSQYLLQSYLGPLPEVMLGLSYFQLWGPFNTQDSLCFSFFKKIFIFHLLLTIQCYFMLVSCVRHSS